MLDNIGKCLLYAAVFIFLSAGAPAAAAKTLTFPPVPVPSPEDVPGPGNVNDTGGPNHSAAEEFIMHVAGRTLGIPYRFGSNSMKATDCSGYVQKVFSFMGIQLPRSVREQFNLGMPVDRGDLSVGDLVFFHTYASFPSHVGIYLGNDLFVHASALARKVTIDNLNTPYFIKRFIGAKRLFDKHSIMPAPAISAIGPR